MVVRHHSFSLKNQLQIICTNINCVPRDATLLSWIQVWWTIWNSENEINFSLKAELVSYGECCMTWNTVALTRKVKNITNWNLQLMKNLIVHVFISHTFFQDAATGVVL